MAQQLYFSRDSKMFLEFDSFVWEIPVLDGFSFSQATNSSEITLNEMESSAGVSRRGRRAFNDSLAPGEWSFSTYVRPYTAAGASQGTGSADAAAEVHAVEEVLWALMAGANNYSSSKYDKGGTDVLVPGGSSMTVNFDSSNVAQLSTFNLYFVLGDANRTVMKLDGCVVGEASLDFDIDGIATITWSGFASMISDHEVSGSPALPTITTDIQEGVTTTSNFIRNRLTQLAVTAADTTTFPGTGSGVYDLVLTGGNITIDNGMTYLTPETLGVVNQPLGHVTGTRSVSGNFTCYLNREAGSSADLFEQLIEANTVITNSFACSFKIGGTSAPKVLIELPKCHFEVPSHSIEDIISLETNFHALPASIDPDSTANNYEAKITYTGG